MAWLATCSTSRVAASALLAVCVLSRLHDIVGAKEFNFETLGAVAADDKLATMNANARLLNTTLQSMAPGDSFLVPNKTFHLNGGVYVTGLRNATLAIDGTLKFANDRKTWPKRGNGKVMDCLEFVDIEDVVFTSSGTGILDGNGHPWWGPINYAVYAEDRPKILSVRDSARLIVENLHFLNSPYWTTEFHDIDRVTIRHCDIAVRWTEGATTHDGLELGAFNTDGFDLSGSNVHIHDCNIWNQDDCIAVKDLGGGGNRARCSENWLVERVHASGLGLTIGSIGGSDPPTCIRNITFRDSVMVNTVKGIYMKARYATGAQSAIIEDILYQNITMEKPEQWAIWIGPAQQADSSHACSLAWPEASPAAKCPISPLVSWKNIVLRDITINNPKESPGVIIGNAANPMQNVVFDNVVVNGGGGKPWGTGGYACYGVNTSVAKGGTTPVPPCFNGGKQCHADGECMEASAMPCCSGKSHKTAECGVQARCGTS